MYFLVFPEILTGLDADTITIITIDGISMQGSL